MVDGENRWERESECARAGERERERGRKRGREGEYTRFMGYHWSYIEFLRPHQWLLRQWTSRWRLSAKKTYSSTLYFFPRPVEPSRRLHLCTLKVDDYLKVPPRILEGYSSMSAGQPEVLCELKGLEESLLEGQAHEILCGMLQLGFHSWKSTHKRRATTWGRASGRTHV